MTQDAILALYSSVRDLRSDEFYLWLQQRSDELVGTPALGAICPLASYLNARFPEATFYVDDVLTYWSFNDEGEGAFVHSTLSPEWAQRFVRAFDRQHFGELRLVELAGGVPGVRPEAIIGQQAKLVVAQVVSGGVTE